ncbi:UDP-N-acetylmuramoyl-L-alanine--D-glutamate ligase [Ilumatobacter nonamiensis]|uniref:UDP-N-acetylmuramoyl-L-alanine--D-glutamate ligase n=1 Tax=Ilumatobacter nonamiensis TaxID=467093 RepID=UPI00058BF614|nr:UDP-N-acetylmuramoyl-L-alanine--D-glutamate ligase [Ilumatobacter nonamiensis]
MRSLVYGLAVAGAATARALLRHGYEVVVGDDVVGPERVALAEDLGVELIEAPDEERLRELLSRCDLLCPSPGVPETHRVIDAARATGTEIVSEIELAYRWEQEREGGPRPMVAVTGTDGKTTTTLMTVAMLRAAGLSTVDAGNTDTPLVDAIELDRDAFVVECTSFRLAWTRDFRCAAAAWLNLAPDHLNWHATMDTYSSAKERIWSAQHAADAAIAFTGAPIVLERLKCAPGRHVTFGTDGDYHVADGQLVGPHGPIAPIASMRRSLPHDITNALAASALVLESGLADTSAIERALGEFTGPPHRLELLGTHDGVEWYNDSKATTPHAAAVAIRAFDDIVLIAGGKDKYVDLAEMAVDRDHVKAVVAIGETREAVAQVFAGVPTVETTEFLPEAVERAASLAVPGDTVLLSPGCASLDQYRSFEARGDHFRELAPTRGGH